MKRPIVIAMGVYVRGELFLSFKLWKSSPIWWTLLGSNQRPSDYESDALTG